MGHPRARSLRIDNNVRARAGFTLVEVLVSIVLIEIGLLALVATGASLVRQTTMTRARFVATTAAANRLQSLGAIPCTASSGTSFGPSGVTERWSADILSNGTRELRDSVTFVAMSATHVVVLRTRFPC